VWYPASFAAANTVGTSTTPYSSLFRLLKVIPCTSGGTPVSIEVCDGSVLLGKIVCASSEYAPSRIIRRMVPASYLSMASGRSPSIETTITCSVIPAPGRSAGSRRDAPAATATAPAAAITPRHRRAKLVSIPLPCSGFPVFRARERRRRYSSDHSSRARAVHWKSDTPTHVRGSGAVVDRSEPAQPERFPAVCSE